MIQLSIWLAVLPHPPHNVWRGIGFRRGILDGHGLRFVRRSFGRLVRFLVRLVALVVVLRCRAPHGATAGLCIKSRATTTFQMGL
jgi:hypothetical protein